MPDMYLPDAGAWITALQVGERAGMADRQRRASTSAARRMSSGDYGGASADMYAVGDFDGGSSIAKAGYEQDQHADRQAREQVVQAKLAAGDIHGAYEAAGSDKEIIEGLDKVAAHARETTGLIAAAAQQLEGLPIDQARAMFRDRIAPGLVARGLPADKVNGFDPSPENLQAVVSQALGLEKTLTMREQERHNRATEDGYLIVPDGGKAIPKRPQAGAGEAMPSAQAASPQPSRAAGADAPRGLRNNNPLNVSSLANGQWDGQVGTDGQYAVFGTPEAGWAAADKNLQAYATRHGIDTLAGVISRWAPEAENDTASYIDTVARSLRVDPNARLNLADPNVRRGVLEAMAKVEVGQSTSAPSTQGAQPTRERAAGSRPGDPAGTIYGDPKPSWTDMSPAEVEKMGLPPGAYQRNTGNQEIRAVASGVAQKQNQQSVALRKEFNALPDVKAFNDVAASYDIISRLGSSEPTAANDISMVFSYMKMLDPGSVVREGEFATAQNAAGIPDRVRNAYNRALNGQILNPKQREQFTSTASNVYASRKARYDQLVGEYRGYASNMGLPQDTIQARLPAGGDGGRKTPKLPGASDAQNAFIGKMTAPRGKSGEASNPFFPVNERQYNALKPGAWYVHPNGQLKQKGGS